MNDLNQSDSGAWSPYHYRTARAPEMQRRLRRTGLIVAAVVLAVTVGAIIYIYFWGGINKGPMEPLHSRTYPSNFRPIPS